jgi:hypothetical protein
MKCPIRQFIKSNKSLVSKYSQNPHFSSLKGEHSLCNPRLLENNEAWSGIRVPENHQSSPNMGWFCHQDALALPLQNPTGLPIQVKHSQQQTFKGTIDDPSTPNSSSYPSRKYISYSPCVDRKIVRK